MTGSTEIANMAIAFEAKKVSVNQNRDGIILRLSIHPSECPTRIWSDWVGTRYQVALVEIGDDEQPTADDATIIANKAIASAGMLCRDTKFQFWLWEQGYGEQDEEHNLNEAWAVSALREALGIISRTEMRDNEAALKTFMDMQARFRESLDGS